MQPHRIFKTGLVREALDAGKTRYFTGKSCKHGHIAERMVSSGTCCECLRLTAGKWTKGINPIKVAHYNATSPKRRWEYRGKRREEKLAMIAGRPRPDVCDICGQSGQIVFDHCHATGKFRGWICKNCNFVLGAVGDSPERLQKLTKYLLG